MRAGHTVMRDETERRLQRAWRCTTGANDIRPGHDPNNSQAAIGVRGHLQLLAEFPTRNAVLPEKNRRGEGHKLREAGFIAVRQIAAFVPAAKSLQGVFVFERN